MITSDPLLDQFSIHVNPLETLPLLSPILCIKVSKIRLGFKLSSSRSRPRPWQARRRPRPRPHQTWYSV